MQRIEIQVGPAGSRSATSEGNQADAVQWSPNAHVQRSDVAVTSVTVRALHQPSLYSDDDLLWLQRILIGRDLGLSLEAIRGWLDDPQFDRRGEIAARRAKLAERAERAESTLRAIDGALAAVDEPVK